MLRAVQHQLVPLVRQYQSVDQPTTSWGAAAAVLVVAQMVELTQAGGTLTQLAHQFDWCFLSGSRCKRLLALSCGVPSLRPTLIRA